MRTWKAPLTSCLLLSVAPILTSLGLGDSHLVILSLCSLVLFFVISFFFFFNFLFYFYFLFISLFVIFGLPYALFGIYIFLTYQKKDNELCPAWVTILLIYLLVWDSAVNRGCNLKNFFYCLCFYLSCSSYV